MADFIFERTGEIGLLIFSGELTEQAAEKLRQGLMTSFESVDYLVVNLTNVSNIDTSCFGMLCTAHRVFTTCNKRILLVGLSPEVRRIRRSAVRPERLSRCVSQCGKSCLWSMQKT